MNKYFGGSGELGGGGSVFYSPSFCFILGCPNSGMAAITWDFQHAYIC